MAARRKRRRHPHARHRQFCRRKNLGNSDGIHQRANPGQLVGGAPGHHRRAAGCQHPLHHRDSRRISAELDRKHARAGGNRLARALPQSRGERGQRQRRQYRRRRRRFVCAKRAGSRRALPSAGPRHQPARRRRCCGNSAGRYPSRRHFIRIGRAQRAARRKRRNAELERAGRRRGRRHLCNPLEKRRR